MAPTSPLESGADRSTPTISAPMWTERGGDFHGLKFLHDYSVWRLCHSEYDNPFKATASRAAISMSSRNEVSSRRIDHLRGLENRLPANIVSATFDGSASDQVHVPSEYSAQLVLHPDYVEERAPSFRIETDQHINIAIGSEIVPHHGAEQSQLRNSPALAEGGDPVQRNSDSRGHANGA